MITDLGRHTVAIIVSYNGMDKLERTLAALRPQVSGVVIVDNGSDGGTLGSLRLLARRFSAHLIELGANLGVGAALNHAIASGHCEAAAWILTMDQDSVIAPDFFDSLGQAIARDPAIVCATPVIDVLGAAAGSAPYAVSYAITSGNLLSARLLREIGRFDEELFIDGVDFDYSLRIRGAGHKIICVPLANMQHEIGRVTTKIPFYTVHDPSRRYYMHRNFVVLFKRYILSDPRFMARLALAHGLSSLMTLLLGPDRRRHACSMVCGTIDGLRGRRGQRSISC